ncbi:MAG: glycerol-3-phosphate dehydrogenase/oxidase [Myxococcales bacterium]|nr:MAG: glycerol-3-phosphate dehydrogenase/oxidase [Myxococcales bacterium]
MRGFSRLGRRDSLERAAENINDVLIVGGGITGAGIAREAALRGFRVVLAERGDFASGTSSRSSKLIHGGVRYLQQGDIALVREAARERAVLRRIAPHLATPARMLLPASRKSSLLKLGAGLWTFERLAGPDEEDRHRSLDRRATLDLEPRLRSGELAGSVTFTEFITSDSRLTLETLQSAAGAGADVISYAEVTRIESDPCGVQVSVRDREGGGDLVIRARCVVNAAGPWFDDVRGLFGGFAGSAGRSASQAESVVQLTRGIHLVVRRERFPVSSIVVLRAPDGRSAFVVPRGEFAYIVTTDTEYVGDPAEPGLCASDVEYLLEAAAATFEDAPTAADIVGTWSGVRPLLRQAGKKPSEISRRDEILTGPGPFVSIAGGKLTTYRRMAERVVDRVREVVGDQPRAADSATAPLAGGSAADQAMAFTAARRLDDPALDSRLWATYGTAAANIVGRIQREPSTAEPVGGLECLTEAEIRHCVENEMVLSLDDLLRRRSHIAMFDTDRSLGAATAAAHCLADCLGWDDERTRTEVEGFIRARAGDLGLARTGTSGGECS